MAEKKKIPEIRFKGYSDDWEQLKLGEVGETFTGLSGKTKDDFGHGEGEFVTYMNVFSNPVSNFKMTEPVEIDKKQNEVKQGDVFFTTSSETPEEVGMSSVWLENIENVYLNSFCFGYRPIKKFDFYYLAYMLRSPLTRKKMIFLAQGISRYNISKNKVMEIIIPKPSINEQSKLGNLFKQIDQLITLHQHKYNKLVNVKKAMLEKMFPKNGADVPEIRFKGFTETWEESDLFQLADIRSGRDYKHLSNGNIPVYGTGGYMLSVNEALSYDEDAIGIGRKGTIDKPYILKAPFWTVDTLFYTVPKEKNNLDFIYDIFQKINWKQKNEASGVPSLSKVAINGIQVIIPNYTEQKKIGHFFKHLDNLLALHNRELEKLKNIKKAFLEKMFI